MEEYSVHDCVQWMVGQVTPSNRQPLQLVATNCVKGDQVSHRPCSAQRMTLEPRNHQHMTRPLQLPDASSGSGADAAMAVFLEQMRSNVRCGTSSPPRRHLQRGTHATSFLLRLVHLMNHARITRRPPRKFDKDVDLSASHAFPITREIACWMSGLLDSNNASTTTACSGAANHVTSTLPPGSPDAATRIP